MPGVPYTRFWASRRDAEDEPSWQALPLQPPSEAGGEVAATNPWLSQGPAIRHGDGRGGEQHPPKPARAARGVPTPCVTPLIVPWQEMSWKKGGNEELGAL